MASQPQPLVDDGSKAITPERPYGDRNQANLNACYPGSPIYQNLVTDVGLKKVYNQIISTTTDKNIESGTGMKYNGGLGHGINNFNTDFSANGVPDMASLEKTKDGKPFGQGEGAPTTAYIPPLTSPGDGSVSADAQAPFDFEGGSLPKAGNEFGSGYGATANPSTTSAEIDNQTLGSLISGRSYLTSDSLG